MYVIYFTVLLCAIEAKLMTRQFNLNSKLQVIFVAAKISQAHYVWLRYTTDLEEI